eukprot:2930990-Prymnesium_polylepis.1
MDDSPVVCKTTVQLVVVLIGMAVQTTNVRALPDIASEDESTDEESELDTDKQQTERAAKRACAWAHQSGCKARLQASADAILSGSVADCALDAKRVGAGVALGTLVQHLEVDLADAVRMKEASLLIEPVACCYADATMRLERCRMLSRAEDASEFPIGDEAHEHRRASQGCEVSPPVSRLGSWAAGGFFGFRPPPPLSLSTSAQRRPSGDRRPVLRCSRFVSSGRCRTAERSSTTCSSRATGRNARAAAARPRRSSTTRRTPRTRTRSRGRRDAAARALVLVE